MGKIDVLYFVETAVLGLWVTPLMAIYCYRLYHGAMHPKRPSYQRLGFACAFCGTLLTLIAVIDGHALYGIHTYGFLTWLKGSAVVALQICFKFEIVKILIISYKTESNRSPPEKYMKISYAVDIFFLIYVEIFLIYENVLMRPFWGGFYLCGLGVYCGYLSVIASYFGSKLMNLLSQHLVNVQGTAHQESPVLKAYNKLKVVRRAMIVPALAMVYQFGTGVQYFSLKRSTPFEEYDPENWSFLDAVSLILTLLACSFSAYVQGHPKPIAKNSAEMSTFTRTKTTTKKTKTEMKSNKVAPSENNV